MRDSLGGRTIGRVAEAHRGDGAIGDHVVGGPGLEARDGENLSERQPADDGISWRATEDRSEPVDRTLDGVVGLPWPRRVPTHAAERRRVP